MTEPAARLKEPRSRHAWLMRDLASAAMTCTHHDAAYEGEMAEPGAVHEVQTMETKFAKILAGKLKAPWK